MKTLFAVVLGLAITLSGVAAEQVPTQKEVQLSIEPQKLRDALNEWARATGYELVAEIEGEFMAPRVAGMYTAQAALEKLLEGTPLTYRWVNEQMVAVRAKGAAAVERSGEEQKASAVPIARTGDEQKMGQRLADSAQSATRADDLGQNEGGARDTQEVSELQEIVVTGTHIRGVRDETSSLKVYSRDHIERTGATSITDFMDNLPQNFAADSGDRSILTGGGSNQNVEAATGINLRGIGAEGTLVLLNGHRLAPGVKGDVVDVSLIPLAALERVEVLTDGASAIYGSDAVAGVVNFVLREDYQGAESRLRVGRYSSSDAWQREINQLFGTSWGSGNALISANYRKSDALQANERAYSTVPSPFFLTPQEDSYSVMLAGSQRATERLKLSFDALYSRRNTEEHQTLDFLPTFDADLNVKQYAASAGASLLFGDGWRGDLHLNAAGNHRDHKFAQEAFGIAGIADYEARLNSVEVKADGPIFALPGGMMSLAVGASARHEDYEDSDSLNELFGIPPGSFDRDVTAAFAELYIPLIAADNAMPGIRRLSFSLAGRYEDYSDAGNTVDPKVGVAWGLTDQFQLRGTYATSFSTARYTDTILSFNSLHVFNLENEAACPGAPCLIFAERGSRQDYAPETSESFTVGFNYEPTWANGLRLSGDYYHIRYVNRIGEPPVASDVVGNFASFPELGVTQPSQAFVEALVARCATLPQCINEVGAFDPAAFDFYLDLRKRNLSGTRTSGLDLDASLDLGVWQLGVAGAYLFGLTNQVSAIAPSIDDTDTYGHPVSKRVTARALYRGPQFETGALVSHTGAYRNNADNGGTRISSWTTLDLRAALPIERWLQALSAGSQVAMTIQNVFNQTPPRAVDAFVPLGFDPSNADPYGRTVSLEFIARW